jgi:hypothetical protein
MTLRTGRPQVLVLEKTRETHKRAAAERRSWEKSLEWLQSTSALF